MYSHILLATDGSDCSLKAATQAVGLAAVSKARLTVLYACCPEFYLDKDEKKNFVAKGKATAQKAFDALSATAKANKLPASKLELVFKEGKRASNTIVDVAKKGKADLIVLGSHGHSGLSRLMLGSVANEVVMQAKCAILIAK